MARHRPKIPADVAAQTDVDAAVRTALAELKRRRDYEHLQYLEKRIAEHSPVPGDPLYVEISADQPKS
ncbi:hypothetical protein [Caulobacter soli]|uniref:hypothetical protein n=1 Tax=Caulobacter soli TaxID=2708539 RepID=UPI0013ED3F71|nr:hypothetical protein [Caulobacter soli]